MFKIHHIFCILALCCTISLKCFDTLSDLQKYAATYAENPKSDDEYWADPDFTSYHKSLYPSLTQRVADFFKRSSSNLWSINLFKKTLTDVLEQRKKAGLSGRKIAHIQLTFPAQFVVWGNIEGSFHSLVRSLTWLNQQGIINNNLELVKSDYYLVFYGTAVNRSAYILETLTVLMLLVYRNPDKVLYVRGDNEDHQDWHNYGLKRELLVRTGSELTGKVPFDEPVSEFFDTLPLAFYASTIAEPLSLMRISSKGMNDPEINEDLFGSFWDHPPKDVLRYYDITQRKESNPKPTVKVIIKSEDWMTENISTGGEPRNMFGLGLLDQDRGATAWAILSAPNMARQKYLGFDHDAFAVIGLYSTIANSAITFYNQKISVLHGFKQHETLNLVSGIQLSVKQTRQNNFVVGSTLGLIGGIPAMSKQVMRGMATRIQRANVEDQLPKTHVSLITYNDDYTPYLAYKNVVKLTEQDHAAVILCPTGSPTLSSYLQLIKENKILTLFPITGNPSFFDSSLQGLINYRATYADEVNALVDYIIVRKVAKKFAFFYQDDAYGLDALKAAHASLKRHGINQWTDIPYLRGNTEFKQQIEILKKENPDSIGFFSTALPTREFMRQLGTDNLTNKTLFGISFLGEESIRTYIKRQGINLLFGAVVPNPEKSNLPIVQEYRKEMDRSKYRYNVFSLEAYIGASILIDALKKETAPTRENVKKYLESLRNYNLEGITLSFQPQRRSLSTKVWIETGAGEDWLELNISDLK